LHISGFREKVQNINPELMSEKEGTFFLGGGGTLQPIKAFLKAFKIGDSFSSQSEHF